jgi:large subunit ribosomal protein L3
MMPGLPGIFLPMKYILGRKIGMSQIYNDKSEAVPVTVISAGPVYITQIKTEEKDGYNAVQVGYGERKHTSKPLKGQIKDTPLEKRGVRVMREFRGASDNKRGDEIIVSIFEVGDQVRITGTTKGKGFQGVVKRHNFHGAPKTHGTKHAHRQPGSIGSTGPQRVFKGQKMAGRMGGDKKTLTKSKIEKVDSEKNLLYIRGAIPGNRGNVILIEQRS